MMYLDEVQMERGYVCICDPTDRWRDEFVPFIPMEFWGHFLLILIKVGKKLEIPSHLKI